MNSCMTVELYEVLLRCLSLHRVDQYGKREVPFGLTASYKVVAMWLPGSVKLGRPQRQQILSTAPSPFPAVNTGTRRSPNYGAHEE